MFEKEVLEAVKKMYDSGMSQEEISRKIGISRSYVKGFVNETQLPKNISVNTLLKVFQHCKIDLNGNGINNASGIVNTGTTNNITQKNFESQKDNFIKEISSKVLNHEKLSDSEKIKFLQILNEK